MEDKPKKKTDGAIWDKDNRLFVKIGENEYHVDKISDKQSEKYPDWKGDDVAVWDRESKKGNPYRFIKVGPKDNAKDYVAFKNGFKDDEKKPDWIIRKSEPIKSNA